MLIVLQTLTDTFGTKNATTNYGCLYIAQGVGRVLSGPMASLLHDGTGAWSSPRRSARTC